MARREELLALTASGGGRGEGCGGASEKERSGRRRWSSVPASGAMTSRLEKAATVWRTGASGLESHSGIEVVRERDVATRGSKRDRASEGGGWMRGRRATTGRRPQRRVRGESRAGKNPWI
jgi:hypothetical protein